MDLVDEQHVIRFEIGEEGSEVARAFQHRPRGLSQINAHFPRDDVRECRLAETRRPEQQYMIERFRTALGRLDENLELAAHLFLADVFVELARSQRALEGFFVRRDGRGRDDALSGEFVGFDHPSIVQ